MHRIFIRTALIAVACSAAARADIKDLGTPGYDTSQFWEATPAGINDAGQIAGITSGALPGGGGVGGAFIYAHGDMKLVSSNQLPVFNSFGIDNEGAIYGYGPGCAGRLARNGKCTSILFSDDSGDYASGQSVSSNGRFVIGYGNQPVVVWQADEDRKSYAATNIGVPMQPGDQYYTLGCFPNAQGVNPNGGSQLINNKGQFVVTTVDSAGLTHGIVRQFVTGAPVILADLGPGTQACAINNFGRVAGISGDPFNGASGLIYDLDTGATTTFTAGGGITSVFGINDRGQVGANYSDNSANPPLGAALVRSAKGVIRDIGHLPLQSTFGANTAGIAINNAGEVTGWQINFGPVNSYPAFVYRPPNDADE
jgi:hypothetical protein